jgi:hypothetical protein
MSRLARSDRPADILRSVDHSEHIDLVWLDVVDDAVSGRSLL